MTKFIFCFLLISFSTIGFAQDILGRWYGLLDIMGTQLPFEFNIKDENGKLTATMDSPDQKAFNIPVPSVSFEKGILKLEIEAAKFSYVGALSDDQKLIGTFKQMGQEFPLNLSKTKAQKTIVNHPQEPKAPFSYRSEEISFENQKAGIKLAGTLTLPSKGKKFPVVILITGSGPQNRDSEMLGHKPFLLWADYLTKLGIAVLRYDDRGVGLSGGKFKGSTTADFATDVEAALTYLKTRKDIDTKKMGLIGHSDGGIIAPIVASRNKSVRFIVLLAGTGIPGHDLLLTQQELVSRASGVSEEDIATNKKMNQALFSVIVQYTDETQLKAEMKKILVDQFNSFKADELPADMNADKFVELNSLYYLDPWMLYFLRYDPKSALTKVKCPVLAVNGDKDLQVPAQVNLDAIAQHLKTAKNKNVSIKTFPYLNHLFQECSTGSPEEYGKIEQTISPQVLEEVSSWILKRVN